MPKSRGVRERENAVAGNAQTIKLQENTRGLITPQDGKKESV